MINSIPFWKSPNFSSRKNLAVSGVVIHYTGGGTALGTVKWFRNPCAKVSAHYVIARSGEVYQCVEVANAAWHAGMSEMKHYHRLRRDVNRFTIGIELANRGYLIQKQEPCGDLYYRSGRELKPYKGPYKIIQVNGVDTYWEPYAHAQIYSLTELLLHLRTVEKIDKQALKNILGHEDVCIPKGRKQDPGPAFPWERIKKVLNTL